MLRLLLILLMLLLGRRSTGMMPVDPVEEVPVTTVVVIGRTELERMVVEAFPEDPHTAMRIVTCESNWNPNAVSRTDDHGLFQINRIHLQPGGVGYGMDPYDPKQNIQIARALYEQSGWYPWVCY